MDQNLNYLTIEDPIPCQEPNQPKTLNLLGVGSTIIYLLQARSYECAYK